MLKLVGTDGNRYYSFELKPGTYRIGRQTECDFCIPHRTVSRGHARIDVTEDTNTITLTDMGSHNGTLVNGERISDPVALHDGDAVMFGQTEFKLTSGDETVVSASSLPTTRLSENDPQKSVFLSINEALKPLPKKVTDQPDLLPTIFEMAKMLVLTEPQEVMLEKSLRMISRVIPAERFAVLFVSDDESEIYTAASLKAGTRDPGELHLSRTIVKEIMRNKNATLISDASQDPRFASQQSVIMSDLKSAIAVPLFDEGKVLGILYADTSNPMHQYNDDYLRVLATFGNILASRLLNYQLLNEREEKQVIARELQRASSIQKNLLVTSPPQLAGYKIHALQEQSRLVGGDLYDMTTLVDGRLFFVVADVSGKGMGAALLMSNILASFRILYESDRFDLARAVQRVSAQLFNYSTQSDFATLFAGVIDPKTDEVHYINAGHNPPLLVRSDGQIEHLEPCGIMIGAFDGFTWEPKTVRLSPGDLIYIFTDGVTEADRGNEQYGEKRMEQLVVDSRSMSPGEIACVLMSDINKFMGDSPRSDDITMLLLKREHN